MKRRFRYSGLFLFCLVLLACESMLLAQTSSGDAIVKREKEILKRDRAANGIVVDVPKIYDDSVLQQMLNAAEARLASLQIIDQTGIASKLGSITGANQQISSFGLSVQGPALPQIATTANGATKQVAETQTPTSTTTVTTTGAPVQNVTTTAPQFNVPTVAPPAASTSLPSSFSVSASDLLNEQLQLTLEIADLRLLLSGSLSDRILKKKNGMTFIRPRTTIGFPIAISPDKRYKGAVAFVEVEVEAGQNADLSDNGGAPAITALLPREKTYNVAAIKDHNVSIGAGVVTQVAGVSGSFLFGHKTYYVVQDQDTIALTFHPQAKDENDVRRIGFSWQFRPVLGEDYVKSGLKQTFVQLAFPGPSSAPSFGKIHVRTYWRKYDRNSGILKDIVKGSLREDVADAPVPTFDMKQDTSAFSGQDLEDLGNGQMLVKVSGNFLSGTYVRVGSTILLPGSPGFTSEYGLIRFIAPIADLATKETVLVTRDGTEAPLIIRDGTIDASTNPIKTGTPSVTAIDETNSLLRIPVTTNTPLPSTVQLNLVIGGKVFGYLDAPILRAADAISVVLPTAFLLTNPDVVVKPLMVDDRYVAKVTLFDPATEIERLVVLEQGSKVVKYLLFGRKLKDAKVIVPENIQMKPVGSGNDKDTLQLLELDPDVAKNQKQLILQRPGERPFVVAVPSLSTTGAAQSPQSQERVTVGADEAVIIGDDLTKVTKALFQKQELPIERPDNKTIKVKGLVAAGVTSVAKTQTIDLVMASGKTSVKLEVVNSKIESVAK